MKKIFLPTALFLGLLFSAVFPAKTESADFTQSYIRLDRQKAQTPTTGLVCAEPSSLGVENNVQVTFPADFTLSTNTGTWTVATTDIPTSATAWPGIGTATSISGKSATFPSSDLTTGILYCFKWSNSQAVTTGSTGQKTGASITTKTLGAVTIDSTNHTLFISNNDQVSLTAKIDPLANSASVLISGSPTEGSVLPQNQELTVTLSYRSNASGSFPFNLSGVWEQGLIEGSVSNYIDIFEYVVGSATSADDGTVPVVDTVNRKVTWNIPALASSSNYHTVSFKLKVRSDIPTDNNVSVKIKTEATFSGTTLSEKSISHTVKKSISQSPSPSPTPTGTITQQVPLRFNFVRVTETSNTHLVVGFQTNKPTIYTLIYGENPVVLTEKISSLTYQTAHDVIIPELKPNTQYYFRITATDQNGSTIRSDLFTAKTSSDKSTIKIGKDDFTVFWRKYFLLSESVDSVVIPRNKPIIITARISDLGKISRIKALFRNENVLGISNIDPAANVEETPLVEILPGISSGEIQTPSRKGIYAIHFSFLDTTGSIYAKSAPYKFYVTDPLKVIDKKTKKPIENARVKILKYDENQKLFVPLENSFALKSKTNADGELDIVLPTGVYSIEVKSPRHKTAEKRVELGISSTNYPVFELEPDYSIMAQINYYNEEVTNFVSITAITIKDFFSSPNNKDLFLIFSLAFLAFLVLLNIHLRKKTGMVDRVLSFSILDILEFLTILSGLLFIKFLGFGETRDLAVSTLIIFALGALYIRRAFFRRKR